MHLTRHSTPSGPRWARDGEFLAEGFRLGGSAEPAAHRKGAAEETAGPESGIQVFARQISPLDDHVVQQRVDDHEEDLKDAQNERHGTKFRGADDACYYE